MNQQITTEEEVKELLNISDFRHLSKAKIIEFASNIPNMSKEVAIKCVEQFPKFKDAATIIVNNFYELCSEAIRDDNNDSLKAYQEILEELKIQLGKKRISSEMKQYIIERMIYVADKMDSSISAKRSFKERVLNIAAGMGIAGIVALAALLGVKLTKH